MPAIITQQPTANQLLSAYKPMVIACTATTSTGGVPTLVLCDVYINSAYYRSFFCSKADKEGKYTFDIQDAVQEKLSYFIPPIDGKKIEITTQTLVDVIVKIRTTKLNASGLNESEQIAPIPGTEETQPILGEGISSNKFFALNLLIQHEENQDLKALLASYQTNQWNNEALPLTRRNQTNFLTDTQSSFFPFVSEKRPSKICVDVRFKGQSNFTRYCKVLTNDEINEVSNPPVINIKWMDPITSAEDVSDKVWDLKNGSFPAIKIKTYATDPDLDITSIELFQKIGSNPFLSLGLLAVDTYDLNGLIVENYEYKAIVTDSKSNTGESNIIKYQVKDTTPGPGVINLEDGDIVEVETGVFFFNGLGVETTLDLTINLGTSDLTSALSDFYEAKGMDASLLRIKFKELTGYTSWRYSTSLVTNDNYEITEVTPFQLRRFQASSTGVEELENYTVMHEFDIYHTTNPSDVFSNYLYMKFNSTP